MHLAQRHMLVVVWLCSLRASSFQVVLAFLLAAKGAVAVDIRSMHSSLTAASSLEGGGRTCREPGVLAGW